MITVIGVDQIIGLRYIRGIGAAYSGKMIVEFRRGAWIRCRDDITKMISNFHFCKCCRIFLWIGRRLSQHWNECGNGIRSYREKAYF